jgi:hypothetical protein
VDWKKVVASLVWIAGVAALDAAYISTHGVDITAIVTGVFALSPAWAFIAKDVDFSFFGQKFHITGSEIASAAAEVVSSAPTAIEQAAKLPPMTGPLKKELKTARITPTGHLEWRHQPATVDPNLALVSLRIEIERRVNTIAELVGMAPKRSLQQTVQELQSREVFPADFADGLVRLIQYGNAAAHGATIDAGTSFSASILQPEILDSLDDIIKQLGWSLGEGT